MKTTLRISAMAAMSGLLLASCSNEEEVVLNQKAADQGKIAFATITNGSTRAKDVYCSAHSFDTFEVFARTADGSIFMNAVEVDKDGNPSTTYYWPNEGTITFYGVKHGDLVWGDKTEEPVIKEFTVKPEAKDQLDLMYARAEGSKSDTGTDKVLMNFRHALSQVAFQAKRTGNNLSVSINSISIANVNGSGSYTLPAKNTTENLAHSAPTSDVSDLETRGNWSAYGDLTSFTVSPEAAVALSEDGKVYSISANAEGEEYNDYTLLLIPNADLKEWDPATVKTATAATNTGTYFVINAVIKQKAHEGEEDIELYAGDIYVPAPVNAWQEGYRYVYTFTFGKGNGGYDEEGKPVLVPISFTCSIDEFIPAEIVDIDMTTKE